MRKYIRHPSDIPIEYELEDEPALAPEGVEPGYDKLRDIGRGGLCFRTNRRLEPGKTIRIRIPIVEEARQTRGIIVWCRPVGEHHDVGVQFIDEQSRFDVRMVEQVCYIERYRREVGEREGRVLTSEEAAVEWIGRYASKFPR